VLHISLFCVCVWYWGLNLGLTPWDTPPALFCDGFSQDRVLWTICMGWHWITVFLISASWVARIIGASHWRPACVHISWCICEHFFLVWCWGSNPGLPLSYIHYRWCFETVSLYSPGWPGTHVSPASVLWVLGLQALATISSLCACISIGYLKVELPNLQVCVFSTLIEKATLWLFYHHMTSQGLHILAKSYCQSA
jgi:hypothetical protein